LTAVNHTGQQVDIVDLCYQLRHCNTLQVRATDFKSIQTQCSLM